MTSRSSSFPYKSIESIVNLLDVGYNGPQKHKYIFWIIWILLEVHISQFGITFDKHVENHLRDRK
jgi:hypothetical protein